MIVSGEDLKELKAMARDSAPGIFQLLEDLAGA